MAAIHRVSGWVLLSGVLSAPYVATAQELLVNPGFEPTISNFDFGWDLLETVTGMPGTAINSAETVNFANQPMAISGELGLWLRAFAGNQGGLVNQKINAVLSQSKPATPGQTYAFSGFSNFEQNYSGGVDTLDSLSPSGAVPTPTKNLFEIAFLDAGGVVIGAPIVKDLVADDFQFSGNGWQPHNLSGVAPAGTASVRVSASALDMVFNVDPQQTAFYDNFALTENGGSDLLVNGNLNATPTITNEGWTVVGGTNILLQSSAFANNTAGGTTGVWLRSFVGGDASVTQTIEGSPLQDYVLSFASKWEANYSGGQVGTATATFVEVAFLDAAEAVIGAPTTLDLRTVQLNDNTWRTTSLNASAPAGTASIRVTAGATGMVATTGAQSAFFDDISLMALSAGTPGDYNGDGFVDAADYTVWRDNLGMAITLPNEGAGITPGQVTDEDLAFWQTQFGQGATAAIGGGAVPEPSTALLCSTLLIALVTLRSRTIRS